MSPTLKIILSIAVFVCSCTWTKATTTAECPHPEDNYPCYCEEDEGQSMMHCNYLTESKEIKQALGSLTNYKVSSLSIHSFSKGTIQSDAFKGPEITNIAFTNSTLQMESPQFAGQENSLTRITFTACYDDQNPMSKWSLGHLQNLKGISFVNNFMKVLGNDWITSFGPSLRSVTFDKCRIEVLGDKVFSKLTELTTIEVSNNQFAIVSRSMFPKPAENLRSINLNDNKITSIPDDFFKNMPSLRTVELERNNLRTLSESSWGFIIENLRSISLEKNPIKCDAKLKWISKKSLPKTFTGHCSEPKKLQNKALRNLTPADFH